MAWKSVSSNLCQNVAGLRRRSQEVDEGARGETSGESTAKGPLQEVKVTPFSRSPRSFAQCARFAPDEDRKGNRDSSESPEPETSSNKGSRQTPVSRSQERLSSPSRKSRERQHSSPRRPFPARPSPPSRRTSPPSPTFRRASPPSRRLLSSLSPSHQPSPPSHRPSPPSGRPSSQSRRASSPLRRPSQLLRRRPSASRRLSSTLRRVSRQRSGSPYRRWRHSRSPKPSGAKRRSSRSPRRRNGSPYSRRETGEQRPTFSPLPQFAVPPVAMFPQPPAWLLPNYPRPFMPPHMMGVPRGDFYPHPRMIRPMMSIMRPPIQYNNRSRPTEVTTAITLTTTTTSSAITSSSDSAVIRSTKECVDGDTVGCRNLEDGKEGAVDHRPVEMGCHISGKRGGRFTGVATVPVHRIRGRLGSRGLSLCPCLTLHFAHCVPDGGVAATTGLGTPYLSKTFYTTPDIP